MLRLGDILVQMGYIAEEDLLKALELQKSQTGKRLGEILVENGFIEETQLLEALSRRLELPLIDLDNIKIQASAVALIPRQLSQSAKIVAVEIQNERVKLVVNDPLDFYSIEDIKSIINMPVDIYIAKAGSIETVIQKHYREIEAAQAVEIANMSAKLTTIDTPTEEFEGNDDNPIVNLVNSVIIRGYGSGASDIHIEPYESSISVRLRVDGQLLDYMSLEKSLINPVSTRIKIISDLDIAEKRIPQDGHFKIKLEGISMNIRVSTIPTVYGEKIVMRFLSQNTALDNEEQFGMNQENFTKIQKIMNLPHGLVYITGPTGSGKTTTLYMMIEQMAKGNINISTIEDPVEKNLPRVNQIQVNIPAGLTFETGLRSLLRQDPDAILVGETRDSQTAEISVSAAITGHIVMSTLHTNDAISTVVRLSDMGVQSYLIASSLVGIVAQRLVKKICLYCKEVYIPQTHQSQLAGENLEIAYRGKGCHKCSNTGYKGRIAVHEVIEIDSKLRAMISNKASTQEMSKYLKEQKSVKFIKENILELVKQGVTSLDELTRHTAFIE